MKFKIHLLSALKIIFINLFMIKAILKSKNGKLFVYFHEFILAKNLKRKEITQLFVAQP